MVRGARRDGYIIQVGHPAQFRRFTDEVLPILAGRGLFRAEYESGTLRGNLGLPVPGEPAHPGPPGGRRARDLPF